MIYFTSDTHFFHDKEFIYKPRGFISCKEMNQTIIANWNTIVKPEDDIFILGDFFLGKDYDSIKEVLDILNGNITLIIGNHDTDNKVEFYKQYGIDCLYATLFKYNKRSYFLSHYPTLVSSLEANPKKAMINLFGHTHNKAKFYEERPYLYNVACDAHNCCPVSITEIEYDINEKIRECKSYL